MSFFENTRKPVGLGGKIMVAIMNFGHSAMAAWGLQFLQPAPNAMVLDCGCGGGANITPSGIPGGLRLPAGRWNYVRIDRFSYV